MQKYFCKVCNTNYFTSRVNEHEKCDVCGNEMEMMEGLNSDIKQLEQDIRDSFNKELVD